MVDIAAEQSRNETGRGVLWTGEQLTAAVGGRWVSGDPGKVSGTSVEYYTSQVGPGAVVFCTDRRHWRGNAGTYYNDMHLELDAIAQLGATCAVVSVIPEIVPEGFPLLLVKNTRRALKQLGEAARARFDDTRVVTITGSIGKTSTKEAVRHLLSLQAPTHASHYNFNHGPGVPMCLARTPAGTKYAVFEFAVSRPGVAASRSAIARPHVTAITSVQRFPDHLEEYSSIEHLCDEKCKIFSSIEPGGTVVLNRDSCLFERQLENARASEAGRVITFGWHEDSDFRLTEHVGDAKGSRATVRFGEDCAEISIAQPGTHHVRNALAALAIVHAVGADWKVAAAQVASIPRVEQRNEEHTIRLADGEFDLIKDDFSVAHASTVAGLEMLALTQPRPGGRRIAVMESIKTLGPVSHDAHIDLASFIAKADIDYLFTYKGDIEIVWQLLPKTQKGFHTSDPIKLYNTLVDTVRPGDLVYLKGDRAPYSDAFEDLVDAVLGLDIRGPKVHGGSHSRLAGLGDEQDAPETGYPGPVDVRTVASPVEGRAFSVLFLGDTAFGENYQRQYANAGKANILVEKGYDHALQCFSGMLRSADVVIANLETPASDLSPPPSSGAKQWVHWADIEKTPDALRRHNIDVVGLANNHTFDIGAAGFDQTLEVLAETGITAFGAGKDAASATRPFVATTTVDGREFTLAVFSAHATGGSKPDPADGFAVGDRGGICPLDEDTYVAAIREYRAENPNAMIVAFPHWGRNYAWKSAHQKESADLLLEAGVDLILGHGAHMLQEIERIGDRWVAYSLGNFAFNSLGRYRQLSAPPYSLVAELAVEPGRKGLRRRLNLYPIVTDNRMTGYRPRFVTDAEFAHVLALLEQRSRSLRMAEGSAWSTARTTHGLCLSIDLEAPAVAGRSRHKPKARKPKAAASIRKLRKIEPYRLDAAEKARQGAGILSLMVSSNGRFVYRVRPGEPIEPEGPYNILRHCGTAWSMYRVARLLGAPEEITKAADSTVRYLVRRYIRPATWGVGVCVVEKDKVKLGGNALAILALIENYRLHGEAYVLDLARALGEYLLFEQRPGGDFVHSRDYATGRERDFHSEYYTGEALLALLELAEVTGEQLWLDSVLRAEQALAPAGYGVEAQSHWMLYALEQLNRMAPSDAVLQHAQAIATHIIDHPDYRLDGRTTPVACRNEGLLAYLRAISGTALEQAAPTPGAVYAAIKQNLALQLAGRTREGAFIRGGGNGEVRIDYVQHNISALMDFALQAPIDAPKEVEASPVRA